MADEVPEFPLGPMRPIVTIARLVYATWSKYAVQQALVYLGTIVLVYGIWTLGNFIWAFIRPSKLQYYLHSKTGSWALVTGANDGIGKAFADELLASGFNVLLHGRNPEKLERVRLELQSKFPTRKLDVVVADASRMDHPEEAIIDKVKHLPDEGKLTVLVNNVGGINTKPVFAPLGDSVPADIDTQININARFPTHLTNGLVPTLKENQPALILNCSSAAGVVGTPYIATYSGTKGYINAMTTALKSEMVAEGLEPDKKGTKGIEVLGYVIGNTRTTGNPSEMPFFTIDADALVRGCLRRVGSEKALEYGNWRQAVQIEMMTMLPEGMLRGAMVPEMKKRLQVERDAAKKQ